jgi:hypothetical protein
VQVAAAAAAAGKVSRVRADLSLFGNVRMPCECILPFLVSPVYLHNEHGVKQAVATVAGMCTVAAAHTWCHHATPGTAMLGHRVQGPSVPCSVS